jgi:hypothetical protein
MGKVEIKKGIITFFVDEQYMKNMTHGLLYRNNTYLP